jgi:8-amino-7-oxononanoate synthase
MGAGASRLVSGEHREHGRLERALADWLGVRSAVLFTSGYAANVGLLPALADGASDLILSDALNHASIVDGCRLARARTRVFPHLDHDAVRALLREAAGQTRRRWVVTESYFSMDADSPDLVALRELCDDNDAALVVDEAHALGVLGPAGRGLCAEADVVPDVLVGTLGKAFGAGGAFVAGCDELTAWLWNRARSFVFSTGLSPAVAEAALAALRTIDRDPTLRADTAGRAEQLRGGLLKLGYSPLGYGHIVPIVVGDSEEAVRLAERVSQEGFTVRAIRPPSVPDGTARIRFTASARQSPADIETLLGVLADRGLGRFT